MSNPRMLAKLLAIMAGLALGMSAYGQGRHDEKPHGPPKKAVKKSDVKQSNVAGRHDEKPHGTPAKVKKADAEKKADTDKK